MSLKEFQDIIKPQIEEILKLLKEQRANNVIEAAATKIIT